MWLLSSANGGSPKRVPKKKWELVHTHTARRTGATLMYLSGMDVYDIMKVTGHSSPIMLKKYIKADQLEVIEKDWWVSAVLRALFALPYADRMSFKGGTSLSKCWDILSIGAVSLLR